MPFTGDDRNLDLLCLTETFLIVNKCIKTFLPTVADCSRRLKKSQSNPTEIYLILSTRI